jgi:hypothetical protein
MEMSCSSGASPTSNKPLVTCIAALFGLSAPAAMAAHVTSCLDDGGPATLRSTIAAAASGDTVDFEGLGCSTITLATGGMHIPIGQYSLTIQAFSQHVTIDGSALDDSYINYSNVLYHVGGGTLKLYNLTVTGGHQKHVTIDALGGCIYSNGNVTLGETNVSSCSAYSQNVAGKGGGIYAKGFVFISQYSSVTGNSASGGGGALGGGVFANSLLLQFGTVSGNSAIALGGAGLGGGGYALLSVSSRYGAISGNHVFAPVTAFGGGISTTGDITIKGSTISGNSSSAGAGGIHMSPPPNSRFMQMYNSTISGNSAGTMAGALYINSAAGVDLYNSTIAFNTATTGTPGVKLHTSASMAVKLQSTVISNNTYGSSDNDLSTVNGDIITFNAGPANNLVRVTSVSGLPGDTKFGTCPMLGLLRHNGGATDTHALLSHSVAIDAGNDVGIDQLTMLPYAYDQRGAGTVDYVRVSGPNADIGAYEVQKGDVVFNAGFDGCNPIVI